MERGQYDKISMHQPVKTPLNETNQVRISNDILTRRLKNRERQRRYRARKRLEAEAKRTRTTSLLQHHVADMRMAHTSVPLSQDAHVVPQRKRAGTKDQSAPLAIEMPVSMIAQEFASRVYCRRDWKQDARRVHLCKDQVVRTTDHFALEQTAVCGDQIPHLSSQANVNPPIVTGAQSGASLVDNDGTRRAVPGRRHWKAEARNKKS